MAVADLLNCAGLTGTAYAAPIMGGAGVGHRADALVTPASVMKIQVALTVLDAIAAGAVDGGARRTMSLRGRTPGPVGISLMRDEVSMSVRDLVVAMLTISDNVATDELINVVGIEAVNRRTHQLGLTATNITSTLGEMLDSMAREVGFDDYAALIAHDPERSGPPTPIEMKTRLAGSGSLDPSRGTRTTARETVCLLQAIWTDRAGAPEACAEVRRVMAQQLTRTRIASGFTSTVRTAAKSGGLIGIIRNEAGVVTFPDGSAYALAIFTRCEPDAVVGPAVVDDCIGNIARTVLEQLRSDKPSLS